MTPPTPAPAPPSAVKRTTVKRTLAQVLLVGGALLVAAVLATASGVITASSTGADRASALHESAELPAGADRLVTWDPDAWRRERMMEPATRVALESAYVRAWAAIGAHTSIGVSDALTATLSGPALHQVLAEPVAGSGGMWSVHHRLRVEFYALDGGTVALTDLDARVVRVVGGTVVDSRETFAVAMVLEDGYWRVRQLRRTSVPSLVATSVPASGRTVTTGLVPVVPRAVPPIRATLWSPDWARVTPASATADLRRAAGLGLDAVRVPVPWTWLGGADVDPEKLRRVAAVFDAAAGSGLRVVPVLFDGLADLGPGSWAGADEHLAAVLPVLGSRPAVAMWDVADGPDERSGGGPEVRAFVLHTLREVRALDPAHPVTVSWSDPALAADPVLAGQVDVVSLRVRGMRADLATELGAAGTAVAGRPLGLVATTAGSAPGWSPMPHSGATQARDVAALLAAARRARAPSIAVERLLDTGTDRTGLLTVDGTPKPAAGIVAGTVGPGALPGLRPADLLASPFWRSVLLLIVCGFAGLALRRWRKRSARTVKGRHRLRS